MATTALNQPTSLRGTQMLSVVAILAAIVASLTLLLSITYLMYRNAPVTGAPNQIDQAQGVNPQYPPATPAVTPNQSDPRQP